MNIKNLILRNFLLVVSTLWLCSCVAGAQQEGSIFDYRGVAGKTVAKPVVSKADMAWKELTSSGPRPVRLPGESALAYFLREVEIANLRRRELGLKFWDAYPDDPRRYSWLQLTIHMPPHYATDITAWAEKETDHMSPNDTPIDALAKKKWDERYLQMRAAFFASPNVTEKGKRFLWFGELQQDLERLREAHARGENTDSAPFLASYADFAKNYSISFSKKNTGEKEQDIKELDEYKNNTSMLRKLWEDVFDNNRELFSWTSESAKVFVDRVAPSLKEGSYMSLWINTLREHISSHKSLPEVRRNYPVRVPNNAQLAWLSFLSSHNLLTKMKDTPEARIVGAYWIVVDEQKRRGIGERLWRTHPDKEMQLRWQARTLVQPPRYMAAFVDGIRLIADGREYQVEMDIAAQEAGEERFVELKKDFFNNPSITKAQKARWLEGEIRSFKITKFHKPPKNKQGNPIYPSAAEFAQHLDSVKALAAMGGERAAAKFAQSIVYHPRRYGLDDEQVEIVVADFRKYTYMQYVVDLYDRRKALKNKPLDFTVPLFNGKGNLSLADLRGKIIYIHTWSTWCVPCIEKMPEMNEAYLKYKDKGFEVVSLVFDGKRNPKGVQRVIDTLNVTCPVGVGDDSEQLLPISNFYMVLNRDGTVYEYYDSKRRKLSDILDEMLAAEQQAQGVRENRHL